MGTLIEKTTYDLGLVVAANMATCGLSLEMQEYYLQNKNLIPDAIRRGFIIPVSPETPVAPERVVKNNLKDPNFWLNKSQEFTEKFLGVKVNLREMFVIPTGFPWESAIPVFDPRGLTNRDAIQKALKGLGLDVWEEENVMKYSGSEANKEPTLCFIQNSIRPDSDTMGMSPNQLVVTGKNWLDLRGYALAFGLYRFATGEYLDMETFTWFPNNRLAAGRVARGYWYPGGRGVGFYWHVSVYRNGNGGSRLAMPCKLIS